MKLYSWSIVKNLVLFFFFEQLWYNLRPKFVPANQMAGFYMKYNTVLKLANVNQPWPVENNFYFGLRQVCSLYFLKESI